MKDDLTFEGQPTSSKEAESTQKLLAMRITDAENNNKTAKNVSKEDSNDVPQEE